MRVKVIQSVDSSHQPGMLRVKLACGHRLVIDPSLISANSVWCHACALGSGKPDLLNRFAKEATDPPAEKKPDPPPKKSRKT